MAEQLSLTAEPREAGKSQARTLRREGRVPAVAYGVGLESTPVHVDERELYRILHGEAGENAAIQLNVAGVDHLALARQIHRHPVRRNVIHLDFVAVDKDRKVDVDVRVLLVGEAPGAEAGGVVTQNMATMRVQVLPLEMPDQIEIDISSMEVGDVKRAGEITLPAGVTLLDDPQRTAVTVVMPTVEEEPEEPEELTAEEAAVAAQEEAEGATAEEAEQIAEDA